MEHSSDLGSGGTRCCKPVRAQYRCDHLSSHSVTAWSVRLGGTILLDNRAQESSAKASTLQRNCTHWFTVRRRGTKLPKRLLTIAIVGKSEPWLIELYSRAGQTCRMVWRQGVGNRTRDWLWHDGQFAFDIESSDIIHLSPGYHGDFRFLCSSHDSWNR